MRSPLVATFPSVRSSIPGCRAAALLDPSGAVPVTLDAEPGMEETLRALACTCVDNAAATLAPLLEALPLPAPGTAAPHTSAARTLVASPGLLQIRLRRLGPPEWILIALCDGGAVTYGAALAHAARAARAFEETWA